MGIKERRDIEKKDMKKKIMLAAIEIIEQEGYEKLSIRKIATRIEYSPTTIYLYYKDKAEIIADMSEELYCSVMRHVTDFINQNPTLSIREQIYDILHIFIKSLCNEPEMVKAIMYSGVEVVFSNAEVGKKPTNLGIMMFDNLLSNGIAQRIFKPNIKNTSWMIVSALIGFVMSSIGGQLHLFENFDKLIDDYVEILIGGIML